MTSFLLVAGSWRLVALPLGFCLSPVACCLSTSFLLEAGSWRLVALRFGFCLLPVACRPWASFLLLAVVCCLSTSLSLSPVACCLSTSLWPEAGSWWLVALRFGFCLLPVACCLSTSLSLSPVACRPWASFLLLAVGCCLSTSLSLSPSLSLEAGSWKLVALPFASHCARVPLHRPHLQHPEGHFAVRLEVGVDRFAAAPFPEGVDRDPGLARDLAERSPVAVGVGRFALLGYRRSRASTIARFANRLRLPPVRSLHVDEASGRARRRFGRAHSPKMESVATWGSAYARDTATT
jgi:hypothetical protein